MSTLPEINSETVARDLAAKLADKEFELSSMKTLAEALLTERDQLALQIAELQGEK